MIFLRKKTILGSASADHVLPPLFSFNNLVLPSFTGFYLVLLGFTGFYLVLIESQLGTEFNRNELSANGPNLLFKPSFT